MANGVKSYRIVVNGVQESINAVDALNKELNDLEKRMNALNAKGVNVNTPKGGGGSYTSELDAQEKLEKQILATEEKLAQVRDENYKKLLHAKEELKEYTQIAKSQVASEANQQGLFDTNTMAGMKASLKSIKAEMQTIDVDSDRFKQLTQQANELNNKLKEIEQGYGQYGRNVGNYANGVAEGMAKLKVDVNGITEEFDTAKQAMKSLRTEMQTLSTKKDLGLISEAEEERLKGLIPVVKQLESSIADAGKPMDALLDTMQSVMAIASVGQGIGALFGMDDGEIEKTIQKLVALQNVMQGLQVLQNQMQSGEGIGGWLAKGNAAIDKMVASMFGLTTATKGATVATKALGVALKAIGIGLIVAAIAELINLYKQWSDTQEKAAKEAEEAAAKIKKSVDDQRNAFVNASAQYMNTASRLSQLRAEYMTTNDQLKKTAIIEEASAEFKKLGINVKSVGDAQKILVNQGGAVINMIREQGNAAAYAALRMEAFKKSFNMLMENGYDANAAATLAGYNKDVMQFDEMLTKSNQAISKYQKQLGINNEKAIKSNGKKAVAATKDIQEEINKARIDAMKEGLRKTLVQLGEDNRRLVNKIKENGKNVAENLKKAEELYTQKRLNAISEYIDKLEDEITDFSNKLQNTKFDIDIRDLESEIAQIGNSLDNLYRQQPITKTLTSELEYKKIIGDADNWDYDLEEVQRRLEKANDYLLKRNLKKNEDTLEEYKQWMDEYFDTLEDEAKQASLVMNPDSGELEKNYEAIEQAFEDHFVRELQIVRQYGYKAAGDLSESILDRYDVYYDYFNNVTEEINKALKKQEELEKEANGKESVRLQHNLDYRYKKEREALEKRKKEVEDGLEAIEEIEKKYNGKLTEKEKEKQKILVQNLETTTYQLKLLEEQYYDEYEVIMKEANNKETEIKNKYDSLRKDNSKKYYNEQIANYRDYLSKINQLANKQPVENIWGIINVKASQKQLDELYEAIHFTLGRINNDKQKLSDNFENGLIEQDDYDAWMRQLNDLEADTLATFDDMNMKQKMLIGQFIASINQYVQYLGSQLTSLLQSVWQYQDSLYEHQMNELDKQIDKYEELLEKQEDITREHQDKIDDIEDELATSRGDRRQHLIDQLNEEIAAQRRSMIEQKRIEREEEKLKKKKEREEEAQRKREHQRQVQQAFISWHLSIANGLATQPFMPVGLAMGALATALGAVQYALVKSQKYADGGVIQGRSHAQGGVKVLGGRAEVEGGEFITNKRTTAQNLDLLEYINSKKKKVDISDLIQFYNGGKVRNNITKNVRTKFADGGVVPSLRTDIDINDRLLTAIEEYAERDVVVSVVDINRRQQAVKNVQVLAGLND